MNYQKTSWICFTIITVVFIIMFFSIFPYNININLNINNSLEAFKIIENVSNRQINTTHLDHTLYPYLIDTANKTHYSVDCAMLSIGIYWVAQQNGTIDNKVILKFWDECWNPIVEQYRQQILTPNIPTEIYKSEGYVYRLVVNGVKYILA